MNTSISELDRNIAKVYKKYSRTGFLDFVMLDYYLGLKKSAGLIEGKHE